jgi:1-acyl-sn-glycerol-3-phosphate acyltransferase
VSNHLGYLDPIAYAAHLRGCFVAREDMSHWPVFGSMSRCVRTIFIDRQRFRDVLRVGREMSDRLEEGGGVLFFPEGTSTGGDDILPFRSGLLQVAVKRDLPVHTAAIAYRTPSDSPPARQSVCWWGDMPFLSHWLELFSLPFIEGRIVFGPRPLLTPDRKTLARRLREEAVSLYKQARGGWKPMNGSGIIDTNVELLQQGIDLLRGLDDAAYTEGEPEVQVSGIGAHFRHCIEYYQQFLLGADSGRIDYAARPRDTRVETDRNHAMQCLVNVTEALQALPAGVEGRALEVNVEQGEAALEGPDADWARSDVRREMGFLMSHTVHHYALIALVLRLKGREPGNTFGVAPSTLAYERDAKSCAR